MRNRFDFWLALVVLVFLVVAAAYLAAIGQWWQAVSLSFWIFVAGIQVFGWSRRF